MLTVYISSIRKPGRFNRTYWTSYKSQIHFILRRMKTRNTL